MQYAYGALRLVFFVCVCACVCERETRNVQKLRSTLIYPMRNSMYIDGGVQNSALVHISLVPPPSLSIGGGKKNASYQNKFQAVQLILFHFTALPYPDVLALFRASQGLYSQFLTAGGGEGPTTGQYIWYISPPFD